MNNLPSTIPQGEIARLNPWVIDSTPARAVVPEKERPIYRIAWKRITGGPGQGKGTKRFTKTECEEVVRYLNRCYPHINHWLEVA